MKIKNMHDIITLVIPTNEPYTFKKYFLESLHNMKELAPIATVAINFQKPWDMIDLADCVKEIENLEFYVKFNYLDKYHVPDKGLVPFNRIRNDAVRLNPNSLFYALTDDDFKYLGPSAKSPSAGEQYLRAVHYMLKYPNCGVVLFGGTMYRYNPINTIGPTKDFNGEWFITGKGCILKSMQDYGYPMFPEDSLDLYGAKEECLLCAARINEGLFPAKMGNSRTQHDEVRKHDENIKPGYEEYGWLEDNIVENNVNKYIRDHYHTNMRGVYNYDVVLPEVYKQKGGINHKNDHDKYLIDYSSYDYIQLLDEIMKIVKSQYM